MRHEQTRGYRLCEYQPVSVEIHHIELHHPVFLRTKLTRNPDSRQRRVLLVKSLHVVSQDVYVPRVALAASRIIRGHVTGLLLEEYPDFVAKQDCETRRIVLGLEPQLLVPIDRRLNVANQKDRRRVAQLRAIRGLRALYGIWHCDELITSKEFAGSESRLFLPRINDPDTTMIEIGGIAGCNCRMSRTGDRREHGIELRDRTTRRVSGGDDLCKSTRCVLIERENPVYEFLVENLLDAGDQSGPARA